MRWRIARGDNDLDTALYYAGFNGKIEAIDFLLRQGANVNGRGFLSPLFYAAKNGHVPAMQLLLDREADVHGRGEGWGETPLHGAAKKGHRVAVKLLLDHHANVNARNSDGECIPLHGAIREGKVDVMELLLDNGSNIENCLILATILGEIEAMRLLLDRGAKEIDASLFWAAEKDNIEVLQLLLDHGANVNVQKIDGDEETPFLRAAKEGKTRAMEFLLRNGAYSFLFTANLSRALHLAARGGHVDAIHFLIGCQEDINIQDLKNQTPLHEAAKHHKTDAIVALIENGADWNKRTTSGDTFMDLFSLNNAEDNSLIENAMRAQIEKKLHHLLFNLEEIEKKLHHLFFNLEEKGLFTGQFNPMATKIMQEFLKDDAFFEVNDDQTLHFRPQIEAGA